MCTVTIQLPSATEKMLRDKASTHGQSLEAYLEDLARRDAVEGNGQPALLQASAVSLAEFDELLDQLAQTFPLAPSLPADFSRADIYTEHD